MDKMTKGTFVDRNPKLKLHADINRLARERGVIEETGLALRRLYKEIPEPAVEQKIAVKLIELEKHIGKEAMPLINRAASLYQLPILQH